MTPEEEKIARALVACPKWQWLPGMLNERGSRVLAVNPLVTRPAVVVYDFDAEARVRMRASAAPDLDDPLTRWGIHEVVRLAFGADAVAVRRHVAYLGAPRASGDPPRRKISYAALVTRWDDHDNVVLWNEFRSTPDLALLAALQGAPE